MRQPKIVFLFVFTLLFSCTTETAPPLPPSTRSGQATATGPALTRAPQPFLANDVLAIYQKSGGIAGINETLIIHQGGLLELTMRSGTKSILVNEPQIQPLRRMLEQKEFGELAPMYQALGADLFTYRITARDANGSAKTVTTMDAAKQPDYLGLLIAMLEQLRAQVK